MNVDLIENNKLNIQSDTEKLVVSINVSQHVAMYVTQNSLRGGVRDSFKINHKTFLHTRMSIGYLEPLDHSN